MKTVKIKTWDEMKSLAASKNIKLQYDEEDKYYEIFFQEGSVAYEYIMKKKSPASADQADFESLYKGTSNEPIEPKMPDGKKYVVSMSKPEGWQTAFTSAGDDIVNNVIFGGQNVMWDFSTIDDEITAPAGYKRKRIEMRFIDPIRIKEGAFYCFNTMMGTYIDVFIVAKAGSIYLKNDKTPAMAVEDTIIAKYVNNHFIQGDCPMGDELNTETAMENDFPTDYAIWFEVTAPILDNISNGSASLELHRERTIVL